MELQAGLGIEPAAQAPHPVVVDPRVEPGGPPLTGETAHPVIGAELVHLDRQRLAQLGRRRRRSELDQPPRRRGQRLPVTRLELAQHPPHGVDVAAVDGPVVERRAQRRDGVHGVSPLQDPVGVTGRGTGSLSYDPLGTDGDLGQPGRQAHVAPVQPGLEPGHRRDRGDQHLPVATVVVDPDDLPDQPMDLRRLHTNKCTKRVSHSWLAAPDWSFDGPEPDLVGSSRPGPGAAAGAVPTPSAWKPRNDVISPRPHSTSRPRTSSRPTPSSPRPRRPWG